MSAAPHPAMAALAEAAWEARQGTVPPPPPLGSLQELAASCWAAQARLAAAQAEAEVALARLRGRG